MQTLKQQLYTVIFGTDTRAGRRFDLFLIVAILCSVVAVTLDSMESFQNRFASELYIIEWTFTLLFTLEYITRIYCSPNPRAYITSFYGIVDFLAILPSYISLLFPTANL